MTNPQQKYPEQKHGYKNCGYHCMMCQQVYYPQINKWLGAESIADAQVEVTSGIFHKDCLEDYFTRYIRQNLPEEEKQKIREGLEDRLTRLIRKVL